MLILSVTSASLLTFHFASAPAAPGRNTTVTPGMTWDCAYTLYLDGSTYLAWKGQGGDNFDAGSTTFSTETQAVINAAPAKSTICFESGDTFSQTARITVGISLTFVAYGATIKWTGAAPGANTAMFCTTVSGLAVNWYGGTLDQNAVDQVYALGFGTSTDSSCNNFYVTGPMTLQDINIINVHRDGIMMNFVSNAALTNTYVTIRNVFVQKEGTGNNGDTTEIDGKFMDVTMTVNDAGIAGLSAFVPVYLQNSIIRISVINPGGYVQEVGFQTFSGDGTSPYFFNDELYVNNAAVALTNGNLASGTVAGSDIKIHGQNGRGLTIGTSGGGAFGGGERWQRITMDGLWKPISSAFIINSVRDLTIDNIAIDASGDTQVGINGLFYMAATNAMDRANDNVYIWGMSIANFSSVISSNIFWASGTGNNKVTNFAIYDSDVSQDESGSLTLVANPNTAIGTSILIISNVKGFSPFATSTVTAGASVWTYTNIDGYSEQMMLKTVAGISAETCNGQSGYGITVNTVCLLPTQGVMTVTWATTAPVFLKIPNAS